MGGPLIADASAPNTFYVGRVRQNNQAVLLMHPAVSASSGHPCFRRTVDPNHRIARNHERLTHFIEEPNVKAVNILYYMAIDTTRRIKTSKQLICTPTPSTARQ